MKINDRKRTVRHGHLLERKGMSGVGAVSVKVPRSGDDKTKNQEETIRFSAQILPPYVRRSKSIEQAISYLYVKGVSSKDFSQVMPVLLGKDATGFSADTVLRLRHRWKEELHQ